MRQMYRKGVALLFGFLMMMAVFAALPIVDAYTVPPVQTQNSNGDNMVAINDVWFYIIMNDPYCPGDQDISFGFYLLNVDDPGLGVAVNRVMLNVNSVRGPDGQITTSALHWDVDTDNGPTGTGYTINSGASQLVGTFQFDISPSLADVPPGIYNITFTVNYEYDDDADGGAATPEVAASEVEYLEFEIRENIMVGDANEVLYAGQTFTDLTIDVNRNWGGTSDLYLNLSGIPAGITFDQTTAWIPGNVGTPSTVGFKVDVARDMAPGIYTVDYQVEYTNPDGVRCTETGTLDIIVTFTPVIEAVATGTTTITQGDEAIDVLALTFMNTGNVDLRDITITPEFDGVFFYTAVDWYESSTGTGQQDPQVVTDIHIDALNVGDNASGQWYVALDPYVQAGDHRLLFDWDATFFDDGSTGNPTGYVNANLWWWDDDGVVSTPLLPRCNLIGGEWIAGPYVMVTVNDDHPDFTAEKMWNSWWWDDVFYLADDLTYVEVGTWINNWEMVGFTDLKATLGVGENTPFLNPLNHSAAEVESELFLSDTTVGPNNDAWLGWYVDLNPEIAPGIYTVEITLTARNADTAEYITTTMTSVVEIVGFGPEVLVSAVANGEIIPGQDFTMNVTITNYGDDTARDVFVSIPDSFIFGGDPSQYWNVIDGFVDSISTYRDDYENGPEMERIRDNANITLEQLNIDDAKDIVDLNLYIEGVYTHPAPVVWLVKANNIAPGESITVTFHMLSNVNMADGRPYVIPIQVTYVDTNGNWDWFQSDITVRTSGVADPYHAASGTEIITGENALGWGFLAVIFILGLLFLLKMAPRKPEEEKETYVEPVQTWTPPAEQPVEEPVSSAGEPMPEITLDDRDVEAPPAPAEGAPVEEEALASSDEVPLVYDAGEEKPEQF